MIKCVMLSRLSDGLILCENNEGYGDQTVEALKMKIRKYHTEVTAASTNLKQNNPLKQIENTSYGIYYRIFSHVIFSVIVETNYPLKLVNAFLESVSAGFFDEAKCILGANNLSSRIQAIEGSHYFIKFDKTIKTKKKQFQDPSSMKNVERLKRQLESIHGIMKQNMNLLEKRQQDLEKTEQKAFRINEESKSFQKNSKALVWHLWIRKNLIWLVLALLIFVIYLCI